MGGMVEYPSNGTSGRGYLALPPAGAGPGVVVIQEWWGLNDQIRSVADRFAAAGFVALAPDLYGGEVVGLSEPDEAGKMMMAMNLERAGADMGGAVTLLRAHPAVTGSGVGVVGFCMGGGLAMILGTRRPDDVRAVVPFYGIVPWPAARPDWSPMRAAVQGHYAELDDMAPPPVVAQLEADLRAAGVPEVEMFVYPGTTHAFANDQRPEVYDAAASDTAFERAVAFLHAHLG